MIDINKYSYVVLWRDCVSRGVLAASPGVQSSDTITGVAIQIRWKGTI